jgi:hypothetical protein
MSGQLHLARGVAWQAVGVHSRLLRVSRLGVLEPSGVQRRVLGATGRGAARARGLFKDYLNDYRLWISVSGY